MRVEDPARRRAIDVLIAEIADSVTLALHQPVRVDTELSPPRRVSTAMGLALHSAPHFLATLPLPHRDGTVDYGEPSRRSAEFVPVLTNDVYERALGLAQWEVDELREEIDRRAGKVLKQIRTVNWLWSFFGLAEGTLPPIGTGETPPAQTLARILFPGTEDADVDLARRGGHLYLLVDQAAPSPLPALFLPWLAADPNLAPAAFKARGVDKGLRTRIARGVGANDDEVGELLEEMIAILPRRDAGPYLHVDQWRSYGYGVITDLGTPYSAGEWLVRPIPPDGADWRVWLRLGPNGLVVKGTPEKVFDALAMPPVTAMIRLIYAAMLASLDRDGTEMPEGVRPDDVDLYDVPRHMRAALSPLLAWAGKSSTHKHVARELGRPVEEITVVLEQVREAWVAHAATSWYGPPGTKTPSIQTLILEHVICLHQSLRRMLRMEPDPRGEHGDLMLLFCAHYLREARLERLWVRSLSDCVDPDGRIPPEDIASHWFWRTWLRILDEMDHDAGSTTG